MSFSSGAILKAGTIQGWGSSTSPDGWLICDGSTISRTLYVDLFNAIGTTYGAGDGITTFNLPNGKIPVAVEAKTEIPAETLETKPQEEAVEKPKRGRKPKKKEDEE